MRMYLNVNECLFFFLSVHVLVEWFRLSLKHMQITMTMLATAHRRPTAGIVLHKKLRLQCSPQCSYAQNMTLIRRCTILQQSLAQKYPCNQSQWHRITSAARAQKAQAQRGICFPNSQNLTCIVWSHPVLNGHSHLLLKSTMLPSC